MSLAEEFFAQLNSMAEAIGLEDDERDSFVESGMKRKGFKPVTSWADPDDAGKDSGDFFSRKREGKDSGSRKTRSGADWQYGKQA